MMKTRNDILADMVRLYASGASYESVAEATSKSVGTVWRWLRNAGIETRTRGQHCKGKPWTAARRAHHPAKPPSDSNAPRGYDILVHRTLGNKSIDKQGYAVVHIGRKKRQYEHVLIAEKALGRKLKRGEVVHHINFVRHDNRNENLLVCTISYHLQLHARMRRHPYWSAVEAAYLKAA